MLTFVFYPSVKKIAFTFFRFGATLQKKTKGAQRSMNQTSSESIIQFVTYLSPACRMRMKDDLQGILNIHHLAQHNTQTILKHHRFAFTLKRIMHYRIFQYRNVCNKELIVKVQYSRHLFREEIQINAWYDFHDVDLTFLEMLLESIQTLPLTPSSYLDYAS